MFNKSCIKCNQPMNGGVYRKPNLCPHCFSIQDVSLTLRNKPIVVADEAMSIDIELEESSPALTAPVYAEIDNEAPEAQPIPSIEATLVSEPCHAEPGHVEPGHVEPGHVEPSHAEPTSEELSQAEPISAAIATTAAATTDNDDSTRQAQATDLDAEIVSDADEAFSSETSAAVQAEKTDLFDADDRFDISELHLEDLQLEAKAIAEKIAFEAAQPAPAFDEDEALYDDHSGIDDDMLFSDEPDIMSSESFATAHFAETSTLSATSGAAIGQLPAAIKESLDISLKMAPSPDYFERRAFSNDTPSLQQKNVSVSEVKTTAPIHFQSKQAVALNTQEKARGSDYESIVLTTETARDIKVDTLLDIVTAECVFEINMMKSNFPKAQKHVEQDDRPSINVLKDARKTVLDTLKKDAHTLGANTVIGLKLKYTEISHGNEAMMLVVATGTAVKLATVKVAQACEA